VTFECLFPVAAAAAAEDGKPKLGLNQLWASREIAVESEGLRGRHAPRSL
jgi:hypothetical protein